MAEHASPEELALRRDLGAIYKAQKDDDWGDWGELTAHTVRLYRAEIERLRHLLKKSGIAPGEWTDPWEALR